MLIDRCFGIFAYMKGISVRSGPLKKSRNDLKNMESHFSISVRNGKEEKLQKATLVWFV